MEAHLGEQEKGCCNTLLQDLMREDLRKKFQSPLCFPEPEMATLSLIKVMLLIIL
ncbi:unnamed protein product [Camellia sinensis]